MLLEGTHAIQKENQHTAGRKTRSVSAPSLAKRPSILWPHFQRAPLRPVHLGTWGVPNICGFLAEVLSCRKVREEAASVPPPCIWTKLKSSTPSSFTRLGLAPTASWMSDSRLLQRRNCQCTHHNQMRKTRGFKLYIIPDFFDSVILRFYDDDDGASLF